ncbi:MAG: hypothetical protein Q9210_002524 [Variospora velana]
MSAKKERFEDAASPSLGEEEEEEAMDAGDHETDVFGREEHHQVALPLSYLLRPFFSSLESESAPENGNETLMQKPVQIRYKTLTWPLVAVLMIAEIVSNGMLSLPSSLAVVGLLPVHNMGDAGYILAGPVGREVLAFGTIVFAVFATGGQILAGQIALGVLSSNKLCTMLYTGIFAIPTLIFAMPRTLGQLSWLSVASVVCIIVAGIVGMTGAGVYPIDGWSDQFSVAVKTDFVTAFISVTNPVFAYAGHFMFFILISEMRHPVDAMKAAYALQIFATTFYAIFAAVTYIYLGPSVSSPSFTSLPLKWSKAAYGIAIPNFLIAGSLYSHTAAKLLFVRFFRTSRHLHEHTLIGWSVWVSLIVVMNAAAFVLAVGVPIFNYLIGIAASLFASWYTYGIAGAFWLYDVWVYEGAAGAWRKRWVMSGLSGLTLGAGAFICVAGMYVTVKQIVDAYDSGEVSEPFGCG